MRTTILAVLMLTITTGAAAQGERELEFGGGLPWIQRLVNRTDEARPATLASADDAPCRRTPVAHR